MLVDTLKAEWEGRLRDDPPRVALEVGSGTGYVICSAALLMQQAAAATGEISGVSGYGGGRCYATDVNPDAVAATASTLEAHGVGHLAEVVQCDLLGPLKARLRGTVDVLLFNPPYVLTPSEEVGRGGIAAAWAGGVDGREVLDRVLPDVGEMLSPGGTFLLLLLEQNKPKVGCFEPVLQRAN